MQGTGKEPAGMPHVLQATGKWTQNQGVASGRSIHHNLGEEGEGQWRAGKGDTGEWMSRGKWEWAWWARPWHANKRKKHVPSHGQTAGNSVQVESVRAYTRRGAWPYYYRLYNSCRAAPTMQSCKCLTYQHTAHSSALLASSTIYWAGPSDYSQDICKTVQLVSISYLLLLLSSFSQDRLFFLLTYVTLELQWKDVGLCDNFSDNEKAHLLPL